MHNHFKLFLFYINLYIGFVCYLLYSSKGIVISALYFFIPLMSMICVIFIQLLQFKEGYNSGKILLLEIVFLGIGLSLAYSIPHIGLFGHDPHWDYSVVKAILERGWPLPNDGSILNRTLNLSEWPMLHFLAIISYYVAKIDLMVVAKYLPIIINAFTILFIYLLTKEIFGEIMTALIVAFSFSFLFWQVFYHTLFIRESIAFLFFFAILFIMFRKQKCEESVLFVILVIAVAFSHHMTSLMLILFTITLLLYRWINSYLSSQRFFNKEDTLKILTQSKTRNILIVLVFVISYWIYIGGFTLKVLDVLYDDILLKMYGTYNLNLYFTKSSLRMMLGAYGNILFLLIFSVVILYVIFFTKTSKKINIMFFALWGWLIIFTSYISTYLFPRIEFSRFILFGYPFLLMSSASTVNFFRAKILRFIFVSFAIFNLFLIPPYIYSKNYLPEYEYGKYREYYLSEEYQAMSWFKEYTYPKNMVAGDWTVFELLGSQQINVDYNSAKVVQIFKGSFKNIQNYDWFIFRSEDFDCAMVGQPRTTEPVVVTKECYSTLNNINSVSKVYDNKEVEFYKINSI